MRNLLWIFFASLLGCANQNPVSKEIDNTIFQDGDQVCLVTGSSKRIVVLCEPVEFDQFAALAKSKDGSVDMIDISHVVELSECIEQ